MKNYSNYESVKNIIKIEKILAEVGLTNQFNSGRFSIYKKQIVNFERDIRKSRPHVQDIRYAQSQKEFFDLDSIIDLVPEIMNNLDSGKQKRLVGKISTSLGGLPNPNGETERTRKARDTLFELVVLSSFFKSGIKDVDIRDNPDIRMITSNNIFSIECKRISGEYEKKINDMSRQGVKQLKLYSGDSLGFVAIDMSKMFLNGKYGLFRDSEKINLEKHLRDFMVSDISKAYQYLLKLDRVYEGDNTLGIIGYMSLPTIQMDVGSSQRLAPFQTQLFNIEKRSNKNSIISDLSVFLGVRS